MSEFKRMVKMETTEPSVVLKLKTGGAVKKADGGFMGMPSGMPSSMATGIARGGSEMGKRPSKPSMKDRRKAMMAKMASRSPAAPAAPSPMGRAMPAMKKGGKAEGGKDDTAQDKAMIKKAIKQHDAQEHKGGKGTTLSLEKGGKVQKYGFGGFAKKIMQNVAPVVKTAAQKIAANPVAQKAAASPAGQSMGTMVGKLGKMATKAIAPALGRRMATGGVVKGQGGYATGGVVDGQGGFATGGVVDGQGGYKKGGSAKKAFAAGGSVKSGSPVAMPQGNKKPQKPIRINELTGVYKKGGSVKKMAGGGASADSDESDPIIDREMARKNAEKSSIAKENEDMRESILGAPSNLVEAAKRFLKPSTLPSGSVTKTEKSVTVAPGKKRGGKVC